MATTNVELRELTGNDFPVLFELRCDPISARMAAFGSTDADSDAFASRWKMSLRDEQTAQRAIVVEGVVVGFAATFVHESQLEVTYWIARSHWGRGIATEALSQLLRIVTARPIYASAAKDNVGSLHVLRNCGFEVLGSARSFAEARGEEIDEVFLELR